ncbi:hypothetical protein EYF80_042904 [Liparis tanakae]|uniref:Uncharacterized protein n=1 Tax=Liparis tanakae TaxID=230148 RepID=A0A4Z2FZX9_9TELE|nr:hypothetical protein EYF80_042904 [Liparis tanakae]
MARTHRSYGVPAARLFTRKFLLDGGIILWQKERVGETGTDPDLPVEGAQGGATLMGSIQKLQRYG